MTRSAAFADAPAPTGVQGLQVALLGRSPYSTSDPVRMHALGIALERQRGVHAIASDRREDFDTWPGTVAYTPPGVDVFSESPAGGEYLVVRWHHGQAPCPPAAGAGRVHWTGHAAALRAAQHLRRLVLAPQPDALAVEQAALGFLAALHPDRTNPPNGTGRRTEPQLRRAYGGVLDRIASDCAQPLTIAQLANSVGEPPLRFLREFTRLVGMTPHAFIVETRVQAARALMAQPGDAPLAAIALDCGFTHQSHMGVAFRKVLGQTPGRYLAAARGAAAT